VTHPVFEITLPNGFGYLTVLRRHPTYGDVLGLEPTLFEKPVKETDTLSLNRIVIFPLAAALKAGTLIARHISNNEQGLDPQITFKFAVRDTAGDPIYWWLWDGEAIKIADLDQDLSTLPERRVLTTKELMAIWEV